MPANRSRTLHWRRCLEQVHERGGAIEIAVARTYDEAEKGNHLVWRVHVLDLSDTEIVVEPPTALGQIIHLRRGIAILGIMAVGQNRWMFNTTVVGSVDRPLSAHKTVRALRLSMPESVQRVQRRKCQRVEMESLKLPEVDIWPLLDPKSVLPAERANELQFQRDQQGALDAGEDFGELPEGLMPDVGPPFTATLLNIGGGGVGLRVPAEHGQIIARHKVFWMRFSLPPELRSPICASAKLSHTHMQSDQTVYAGLAFDFTFNVEHHRFVVEQICRYIEAQLAAQDAAIEPAEHRRSA